MDSKLLLQHTVQNGILVYMTGCSLVESQTRNSSETEKWA